MANKLNHHNETTVLVWTNAVAVSLGLIICGLMLLFLKINPLNVFGQALKTIFTDAYTGAEVFLKATPLIFTALSFAFTYKASLYNIGAQGQFYAGAIASIALSLQLEGKVSTFTLLLLSLLAALLAGGLIGGLIGFLKARFQANEFLVSMMSTYAVIAFMNYLLRTALKENKGEYPQTDALGRAAWIPSFIPGTRLHYGFILAILTAIGIWVLLNKTPFGFRVRSVGYNQRATELAGIKAPAIFIMTFFISGALSGMAGFTEINGVQHMLIQDFNPFIGAAGLGIAILANANPIAIIFASILFGALSVIGMLMGRMPGINVPASFVPLMQGTVMVFVIGANFFRIKLHIKREKMRKAEELK